jgi:hypothetical protein
MERNTDEARTLGRKKTFLGGSFRPNGTGAILDSNCQGGVALRTGVGTFTVTFSDKVGRVLGRVPAFQGASDRRIQAVVDSYDLTTKVMTITLWNFNTNAAVDETASAQRVISYLVEVDDAMDL